MRDNVVRLSDIQSVVMPSAVVLTVSGLNKSKLEVTNTLAYYTTVSVTVVNYRLRYAHKKCLQNKPLQFKYFMLKMSQVASSLFFKWVCCEIP